MEAFKIIQAYDTLRAHSFKIVSRQGNKQTPTSKDRGNFISYLLGDEFGI